MGLIDTSITYPAAVITLLEAIDAFDMNTTPAVSLGYQSKFWIVTVVHMLMLDIQRKKSLFLLDYWK